VRVAKAVGGGDCEREEGTLAVQTLHPADGAQRERKAIAGGACVAVQLACPLAKQARAVERALVCLPVPCVWPVKEVELAALAVPRKLEACVEKHIKCSLRCSLPT
jgi:hypothetical protein